MLRDARIMTHASRAIAADPIVQTKSTPENKGKLSTFSTWEISTVSLPATVIHRKFVFPTGIFRPFYGIFRPNVERVRGKFRPYY